MRMLWLTMCALLVGALYLCGRRQRPLRLDPSFFLVAGMPLIGTISLNTYVLGDPWATVWMADAAMVLGLVVGRGRPLDLVPPEFLDGLDSQQEMAQAATYRRRGIELGAFFTAVVVLVLGAMVHDLGVSGLVSLFQL
jgi:hypothetical protein